MEFLNKLFKLEDRGTKVSTELVAGLTTFLAMAYILPVNAGMLSKVDGLTFGGVFIATALAAGLASIVMGLLANLPVALAPGIGLNAFFTYTLVFGMGLTAETALAAVFVSGYLSFIFLFQYVLIGWKFGAVVANYQLQKDLATGLFLLTAEDDSDNLIEENS